MTLEKQLFSPDEMTGAIKAVAAAIVSKFPDPADFVLVGLYKQGVPLMEKIAEEISRLTGKAPQTGKLDITMYRDDFGKRQRIGSALRPAEAVCTALPLRSGVLDVIEDRKLQVGAGEAFEDGFRLFPGLLLVDGLGVEVDAPVHMVEPGPAHVPLELRVLVEFPSAVSPSTGPDDRELDAVLGDLVPADRSVVGGDIDAETVPGVVGPKERDGDEEDQDRQRQELGRPFNEVLILFPKLFGLLLKRAAPAPGSG